MKAEIARTITELLDKYYHAKGGKKNPVKIKIKEEIKKNTMELVYFWPQIYFGLSEEDCAEFLLWFDGRIEGLLENYDPEYKDFGAYIYPILEKSVKGYQKERIKRKFVESSFLFSCAAYEYLLDEYENSTENMAVSEVMKSYGIYSEVWIQRMYSIFVKFPIARERFYIYMIAHSSEITIDIVHNLCNTFYFNFEETWKLIMYIENHRTRGREDVNHAIEKKNEYFGKRLFLENELAQRNALLDHSMDQRILHKLEKVNFYYDSKSRYIRSQHTISARKIVSDIVHKNYGTVGTYMMYTVRLINWCEDPSVYRDFGLSEKSLEEIAKAKDFSKFISQPLPMLNPISHFRINISLNS